MWLFWLFISLLSVTIYLVPVGIVWERRKPKPFYLAAPLEYHKQVCGYVLPYTFHCYQHDVGRINRGLHNKWKTMNEKDEPR